MADHGTGGRGATLTDINDMRSRANRLLAELRSAEPSAAASAALRLRELPEWKEWTPRQIRILRHRIRRREALEVIARESGFRDWSDFRVSVGKPVRGFDTTKLFRAPFTARYLNLWLKDYNEGRQALAEDPSLFLFPHKQHFVVCDPGLLRALGVNPEDPDWQAIGHDWVKPGDLEARARLAEKLRKALG